MTVSLLIILLLALYGNGQIVAEIEEDEILGFVKKKEIVFITVHKFDCLECPALIQEIEKAAKIAKKEGKHYKFAKINADENPRVGEKMFVPDYPTMRLYVNASSIPYKGVQSAKDILEFIDRKSLIQSKQLNSRESLKELIGGKGLRVIN